MGNNLELNPPSKEVQVTMLKYALLEIRASDNLDLIRNIADVFHNFPNFLNLQWSDEVAEKSYNQILHKAQKNKLIKYIHTLRDTAEIQIKKANKSN